MEQFRRVGNMYFLIMGFIMAIGWYTSLYESAINPWTTLGPLALVIAFSLIQEGNADLRRHQSDAITNHKACVLLRRADELDAEGGEREKSVRDGEDVEVNLEKARYAAAGGNVPPTPMSHGACCQVAFESAKRMNIYQGQIVMIRNRDMIPADLILLASSADYGNVYIETMSIDGETNLKLRTSPRLPESVAKKIHRSSSRDVTAGNEKKIILETLEQATKRICRLSALGFPNGLSALKNPANPKSDNEIEDIEISQPSSRGLHLTDKGKVLGDASGDEESKFVMALISEPPNASVNTFNGVLWLPPIEDGGPSVEIPLNGDNILLRGAVLRNTEWAIGLSCFTGQDTKLVQNSFATPSKFSRFDQLTNSVVYCVLGVMFLCIACLASLAVSTNAREFDTLRYVLNNVVCSVLSSSSPLLLVRYLGINSDINEKWPTLPNLEAPKWNTSSPNWVQMFFLFVTLLNNFLPISLYVTLEFITIMARFYINFDLNMYDAYTNTRTVARSTAVSDLGRVEYIFSDKTGTLTQNVMTLKRCSVDGLVFGAPIVKATPGAEESNTFDFQTLDKVLVGKSPPVPMHMRGPRQSSGGLVNVGTSLKGFDEFTPSKVLSFNAEMFLRVMSLCHTVVVENDLDANHGVIDASSAFTSQEATHFGGGIYDTIRKVSGNGKKSSPIQSSALEGMARDEEAGDNQDENGETQGENADSTDMKGNDGAPSGFAFQAESPDEGALVEASSLNFNFQVIGRDSSGITLSVGSPSLFSDNQVVESLKNGSVTELELAADTASPKGLLGSSIKVAGGQREETWEVLAVNKFDSTRKRMSIIVRSPPELGSIPMLLCKGADSAILDSKILRNASHAITGDEDAARIRQRGCEPDESKDAEWDRSTVLSLQSHLGEFAREGLRTLVMGVRILTEEECSEWLVKYTAAATSLKNRDEKLTAAAEHIETQIHIVGATAIEDKLQDGVAGTIATLGDAGIKLWVLTGDKRETAKEIGYATKVLTEKMRPGLTEVATGSKDEVRTKMAMAFLKLVKYAKLPEYQKSAINADSPKRIETILFRFRKFERRVIRALRRFYHKYVKIVFLFCCTEIDPDDPKLQAIDLEEQKEKDILQLTDRRRNVRNRAEKIVRDYLNSSEGMSQRNSHAKVEQNAEIPVEDMNMPSTEGPDVFSRASSAQALIRERQSQELTTAKLAASGALSGEFDTHLVDEDIISMNSFLPTDDEENTKNFDTRKRTLLERVFAADKAVRHGRLVKHLTKEKSSRVQEESAGTTNVSENLQSTGHADIDGPRGLVIEGAALEKLLGDSELEEILFAVANTCDSVIACRVSPAQKAQLVRMVRRYIVPEPVTLAIGDGANDVGMIQEAHAGVGISGKEGTQAVNASDFAIAQFRFLQDLILVHGRWSFMRLVVALLFSLYKNAVMVGCLIIYSRHTLYSGTPFFDQWNISIFNFVAALPIWAVGAFDRCLDREYVLKNPEVYTPTRRNELITKRVLIRWIILVFVHISTVYFLSVPSLAVGGASATSAFLGLMRNKDLDRPGDGEGGDLKSVGFVAFTSLVLLVGYKVLYESRSIIIGIWPACQCWKKDADSWPNRLAWTWVSVLLGSFAFFIGFVYIYQLLGHMGPSLFSDFTEVVVHAWQTRSLSWMSILLVPIAGIVFDVSGKVFSNLFFPTQTQIHVELFAAEIKKRPKGNEENQQGPTTGMALTIGLEEGAVEP